MQRAERLGHARFASAGTPGQQPEALGRRACAPAQGEAHALLHVRERHRSGAGAPTKGQEPPRGPGCCPPRTLRAHAGRGPAGAQGG